jgi:hypothetical protein
VNVGLFLSLYAGALSVFLFLFLFLFLFFSSPKSLFGFCDETPAQLNDCFIKGAQRHSRLTAAPVGPLHPSTHRASTATASTSSNLSAPAARKAPEYLALKNHKWRPGLFLSLCTDHFPQLPFGRGGRE